MHSNKVQVLLWNFVKLKYKYNIADNIHLQTHNILTNMYTIYAQLASHQFVKKD